MTAQPPLPLTPSGAVPFGAVAALVQDDDGGRVFIRGELSFVWDAGDEAGRRLAAVQLVRIKAASLLDVAAAFAVSTVTLWRWCKELDASGAAGLAWRKRGPKGPSRLTDDMVADIRGRRSGGATLLRLRKRTKKGLRSYCGHPGRLHYRCSLNVLLCELGHQARQAHQEDVLTSRTDTQNAFLCRVWCASGDAITWCDD